MVPAEPWELLFVDTNCNYSRHLKMFAINVIIIMLLMLDVVDEWIVTDG